MPGQRKKRGKEKDDRHDIGKLPREDSGRQHDRHGMMAPSRKAPKIAWMPIHSVVERRYQKCDEDGGGDSSSAKVLRSAARGICGRGTHDQEHHDDIDGRPQSPRAVPRRVSSCNSGRRAPTGTRPSGRRLRHTPARRTPRSPSDPAVSENPGQHGERRHRLATPRNSEKLVNETSRSKAADTARTPGRSQEKRHDHAGRAKWRRWSHAASGASRHSAPILRGTCRE